MPLRIAALSGIIAAFVGPCFASYLAIDRLVEHEFAVPGWTSIIVIVFILSGLQLTILGMLGEYLWRALDDARQRPIFFVQSLVGHFGIPDESTGAAMRSGPSAALPIAEEDNRTLSREEREPAAQRPLKVIINVRHSLVRLAGSLLGSDTNHRFSEAALCSSIQR
jgi:hypothetical protein